MSIEKARTSAIYLSAGHGTGSNQLQLGHEIDQSPVARIYHLSIVPIMIDPTFSTDGVIPLCTHG